MKYMSALLVLLSLLSSNATADTGEPVAKPFSIGFGTYVHTIAYDDSFYRDDEYSGIALSGSFVISNSFALRGTYFSLEDDNFSEIDSTGFDFLGHFGTGLASEGFKVYVGGGIFKDTIEVSSFSKSFSGLQLSGGLGYNWQSVSLDLIIGIRDSSDYEDFINEALLTNVSATSVSGSLILSARF